MDRHQLTGNHKMVRGRSTRGKLVQCVAFLYTAWREALQASPHLEEKAEPEESDEEVEEEFTAQTFAENLAFQLESFHLESIVL